VAERATFGVIDWQILPRLRSCYEDLKRWPVPTLETWQVIHGDLAGNFLFSNEKNPIILDFTPKWSPVGFGEAVMAVDICLWEQVALGDIASTLSPGERALLPLATLRRLLEVDTLYRLQGRAELHLDQVEHYHSFMPELELVVPIKSFL
jgi:hypothetical protein